MRHSTARNVIERGFAVTQNRFPILKNMLSYRYPYATQCELVMCVYMTHNFIRLNQLYEDVFDDVEIDEEVEVDYNANVDNEVQGTAALHNRRDNIAQSMWNNYTNAPAN